MENKKTKIDLFLELKAAVERDNTVNKDELVDFIDKEIEILEKRKVAAKERAEKKKSESDALTDEIFALVTEEVKTVEAILEGLDDEDITRNKVTARLGKLVKAGLVVKESVKVDGNRRMAYRRATEEDEIKE